MSSNITKISITNFFKVFGCSCFPFLRAHNAHKFSFKIDKCTFLGYSPSHKGYRCLHKSGRIYMFYSMSHVFHIHCHQTHQIHVKILIILYLVHIYQTKLFSQVKHSGKSRVNTITQCVHSQSQSLSQPTHETTNSSSSPYNEPITSSSSPTFEILPYLHAENNILTEHRPHTPNTHPMTTRSKNGIFKPQAFTIMSLIRNAVRESLTNNAALQI